MINKKYMAGILAAIMIASGTMSGYAESNAAKEETSSEIDGDEVSEEKEELSDQDIDSKDDSDQDKSTADTQGSGHTDQGRTDGDNGHTDDGEGDDKEASDSNTEEDSGDGSEDDKENPRGDVLGDQSDDTENDDKQDGISGDSDSTKAEDPSENDPDISDTDEISNEDDSENNTSEGRDEASKNDESEDGNEKATEDKALIYLKPQLSATRPTYEKEIPEEEELSDEDYAESVIAALKSGEDVTLERNITVSEKVVIDENVTASLDLNGYDVTLEGQSFFSILGELELCGEGTVEHDSGGTIVQVGTYNESEGTMSTGSSFTLDGPTLSGGSSSYGISVFGKNSVVNILSGEIDVDYYAVSGNGLSDRTSHSEINIEGGSLTSRSDVAIYHPQRDGSTINVSGGTIEGNWSGIQMCSGSLNIEGDPVIRATSDNESPSKDDNASDGSINDGAAISIINRTGYGGDLNIKIDGGTFESETSPIKYYGVTKNVLDNTVPSVLESLEITGGVFNGGDGEDAIRDYYSEEVEDTVPEGAKLKDNESVKVTGGEFSSDIGTVIDLKDLTYDEETGELVPAKEGDFGALLRQAVANGESNIVLDAETDYTLDVLIDIPEGMEIAIDMNGAQVKLADSGNILKSPAITVNGKLTIENGSFECPGSYAAISVGSYSKDDPSENAELYINNVIMEGTDAATLILIKGNDSKLTIDGEDTIIRNSGESFAIGTNGAQTDGAQIIINAGTVISEDCTAMYLPGKNGNTIINGGYIRGYQGGIQLCAGSFEMNGGTVECDYDIENAVAEFDPEENDGTIVDGAAISYVSRDGYAVGENDNSIVINGGEIRSANNPALLLYGYDKTIGTGDFDNDKQTVKSVEINGGSFEGGAGSNAIEVLNTDAPEEGITVTAGSFSSDITTVNGVVIPDGTEMRRDESGNWIIGDYAVEEPEEDDKSVSSGSPLTSTGTYYASEDAAHGTWKQDERGWWFELSDGKRLSSAWAKCYWNGALNWYHFNDAGYLDSGWMTDEKGNTYYLHDVHDGNFGYMYTGWNMIGENHYYFSKGTVGEAVEGAMLKNATTPDGYRVGNDGAWDGEAVQR